MSRTVMEAIVESNLPARRMGDALVLACDLAGVKTLEELGARTSIELEAGCFDTELVVFADALLKENGFSGIKRGRTP